MSKIEIVFIVGLLLIVLGIAFIYWPVALIFAGTATSIVAFKMAQVDSTPKPTVEPIKEEVV
jgi:hypothetical protein